MMRGMLNLKTLKHSPNKKRRTIYEKAHRMMQEDFETARLSEKEIMAIANRFPQLEVRVMAGETILIKSKKDTWVVVDEGRFLSLYHKGISLSKGKIRENYHIQDVFYDLEFILASIISHDDHALGIYSRGIGGIKQLVAQSK